MPKNSYDFWLKKEWTNCTEIENNKGTNFTLLQQHKSSYKSESRAFSIIAEKSYNKPVIDFNFGRHKDLSTLKCNIYLSLEAFVNITFLCR